MIGSAAGRLDVRVKEEPYLSKQEQLLAPSTSRMKVESDNTRYNSTMQIKPEPVDDHKLIFSSKHHHSVPRDPRRLLVPEIGNSQPSRDPRKRGGNLKNFVIVYLFDFFGSQRPPSFLSSMRKI